MKKVVKCSTPRFLSPVERNGSGAEKIHLSETCAGRCIWDKVFKNGPSEICGKQPLKYLK